MSDPAYLAREAMLMDDYDRGEMNIADYVRFNPGAAHWRAEGGGRCAGGSLRAAGYYAARLSGRRDLLQTCAQGEQMLRFRPEVSLVMQAVASASGLSRR